ncbi:hypothetical protein G9A89_004270 [Geosiphon pyriformis]|nr:hypothetical protein G9A89_004270 [Geosiphon pyriformis]
MPTYLDKKITVDDWRRVVWFDESKYQSFGSDGPYYNNCKFGGRSIMVWDEILFQYDNDQKHSSKTKMKLHYLIGHLNLLT